MTMSLILYNIRSAHNVGSIFRTADAAGVDHIYLVGTTPQPIDRFGRPVGRIAKVALGAEQTVPWTYVEEKDAQALVEKLKDEGQKIVSVEQDNRSVDYKEWQQTEDTVFVLGDEVQGVSQDMLNMSDAIIEILMKGKKESLNVSVAAGIVLL